MLAHFDCALTLEHNEACEAAGTEGQIVVPSAFLPGKDDVPIRKVRGGAGEETEIVPGADQYQEMVEHFSDCVLHDRPFRYPAEEAALNMRTIEALYRSARNGGRSVVL